MKRVYLYFVIIVSIKLIDTFLPYWPFNAIPYFWNSMKLIALIGLVYGLIKAKNHVIQRTAIAGVTLIVLLAAYFAGFAGRLPDPVGTPGFTGSSSNLSTTIIASTLDASMEESSNVIWCASFLAAWKVLAEEIAEEPILSEGNPENTLALNQAIDPRNYIPEECLYSAAGRNQNGVINQIASELAQKFPGKSPPVFSGIAPDSIVAYSYLEVNLPFSLPYFQNREPLIFMDSNGTESAVSSFGIRTEDDYAYFKLRKQIEVLQVKRDERFELEECILDLDHTSSPNQLILAIIDPQPTLAKTLTVLQEKMDQAKANDYHSEFGPNDVLLVPDIVFQISHRFHELENLPFENAKLKGLSLDVAQQDISFRLDRHGAELRAESKIHFLPIPTHFIFDRPFLICMKKRSEKTPFFVMWIDNAELLTKW